MAAPELSGSPRISVVVPTCGRRDLVLRLVRALSHQELRDFEAIVVLDGADDGTAEALRALETEFPLRIVEQPHRGAAAARNAGAATASGEILLFLDDDMAPDAALLAEHDRSQRGGAQVVLGHLPLDPSSPPTAVAAAVGRWAERRLERLSAADGEVPVPDLITGQMSVRRDAFERLGGFDVAFTRGGLVPGADRDFGYRARRAGLRVAFNPVAISRQHYEIDAREHTRRSRDGARGDRILAARYPEIAGELWEPRFDTAVAKLVLGPLVVLPRPLSAPVRALAVRLFSRRDPGRLSNRLFFAVQTMERRRGAREGRRELEAPIAVVLAYHSISSLAGDRILGEYGTPPEGLERQLDRLARDGWHFVELERFLDALDGTGTLPERAVLLTFDDGYVDLLTAACPILASRGIPAVVFPVADRIGRTNEWRRGEATELRLLDAEGLRRVSAQGVVVGSHGATHRPLVELERFLDALDGTGTLPERAVLLTFDDGYVDLLTAACPALASRGIPAVVFPVADRIGRTNEWRRGEATELQLLDAEGLRRVSAQGVVVGSHGATHRPLVELSEPDLERELAASAERIASLGVPRPTVFSYPHGEWSPAVAAAVERAGYLAAFTVSPGAVTHTRSRYALPRIEVLASDTERGLARRLATASRRRRWAIPGRGAR